MPSNSGPFSTYDPKTLRTIDVARSFAPQGAGVIAAKSLIFAVIMGTYIYYWIDTKSPAMAMAFLTNWGYTAVVLYSTASLLSSLWGTEGLKDASSLRVRTIWVLFELGMHLSSLAAFGYFAFLFDPAEDWKYLNIAMHGGVLPLVLIDGIAINRIPVRMIHYIYFIIPVELLYIAWTLIHSRTDIGNPLDSDSDALYAGSLEWTEELWLKSLVLTAILLLVVGPIAWVVWWALANGTCCCRDIRRYEAETTESLAAVEKAVDSTDTTEGKFSREFTDPESPDGTEELV